MAAGAGDLEGGLLGWDTYEHDYFGIDYSAFAEDEAKKKLKQMSKDELITSARQCIKVYHAYIGLRTRYDSLKAAIDILRDQNTGYLQVVKEIEKLYELRMLIEGLTIDTYFATMGASNCVNVEGHLPKDRNRMIKWLDEVIGSVDETELRRYRENLRHL